MTACAVVDATEPREPAVDPGASRIGEVALPRFTLRKRKASAERESAVVPSVNSALLDGLFADVAEIHHTSEKPPAVPDQTATGCDISPSPAAKKSRASLTHSISRCSRSFKWLGDAFFPSATDLSSQVPPEGCSDDLTRQVTPGSSTNPQVKCVSRSSALAGCPNLPSFSSGGMKSPSIQNLPTTVSLSSCNTLTRVISDLQTSAAEIEEKESYGWFVEMDGEPETESPVNPYHKSSSTDNLAFVASTAPKGDNQDAEVEWAKAADTVDSVLGDFF